MVDVSETTPLVLVVEICRSGWNTCRRVFCRRRSSRGRVRCRSGCRRSVLLVGVRYWGEMMGTNEVFGHFVNVL